MSTPQNGISDSIREIGIVAIMRAKSSEQLLAAGDAVLAGGVNAIEVTMTTPGALRVIEEATSKYGEEVIFGVGSVLDPETARAAILAGAQFVVCPTLNMKTIEMCKRYSIPVVPGAYTPTEVLPPGKQARTWSRYSLPAWAGRHISKPLKPLSRRSSWCL